MHTEQQIRPGRSFFQGNSFFSAKPALVAAMSIAAALFCFIGVGQSSGSGRERAVPAQDDHTTGTSRAAIEKFWTIYHGNDYAAIPEAQEELQKAIQSDPNNPTLYALLGATHFWHVGEFTRDPNWKAHQNVLAQDMPTAASLFQKALDLDYYTQHPIGYINDDHLPGYLGITTVHTGQEFQNLNLIAKGDGVLDFAAYQFPEFNNFNRWAAHLDDARDSQAYNKALDSLWQSIDACIGTQLDRTNPDMKPYLQLVTSVGRKKACWWEGDIAPYGFEGLVLNLGNGLVKAGQVDAARVMYANARYAANYDTWPYRDVLETIAASDLNARAALYAPGANLKNAPPLNVPNRSCVYCHATVPESGARE
jgi:tetratricopeptide (TPR) repeat protein